VRSDACEPTTPVTDLALSPGQSRALETSTRGDANTYTASCGGGAEGGEQVVAVRAAAPGVLTVTVERADYDPVLFARASCERAGSESACNDDASGVLSAITLTLLSAGVTYVFVDGFSTDAGAATVRFTLAPLAACRADADCPSGRCVGGACQDPECFGDFDCAPGEVCQAGACEASLRCQQDLDCVDGQICEAQVCAPGQCAADADCGATQICEGFRCARPECRRASDCAAGQACVSSRCVAQGGCAVNADCGPSAVCSRGACVAVECTLDAQCAPGERCVGNACAAGGGAQGDPCASDVGCSGSLICEGGRCASSAGRCAEASDCGDGACLSGQCLPAPACQASSDCANLIPLPVPLICSAGICRSLISQCAQNADCGGGQTCLYGLCAPIPPAECLRDADCGAGRLCEGGRCG